ncbi:MAG: M23 family metallopeptidase [Erysipelotrichales bacterium]|nr:M23 family metallopeptidase [Erysipelotrichales bacterium]
MISKKRLKINFNISLLIFVLFMGITVMERTGNNNLITKNDIQSRLSANTNFLRLADMYTGFLVRMADLSTVSGEYYEKDVISIEREGNGVRIRTHEEVALALEDGLVVFIGRRNNIPRSVVIKTFDGREIIFGDLEHIEVSLYKIVRREQIVGTTRPDNEANSFFLAIRQGTYLDVMAMVR